ncbi:Peptidase family S41 [Xylanibacter oryzae DSM 17970]|uniref:Peptidase family S41 n=1 Tax=Xylanibacter oryzae DSM 17970 TaxID=915438 RepID=A0ABP3BFD3_9BACT|nr:Peptidase family S41 [Xylanibacter oryzae DSM 17970]
MLKLELFIMEIEKKLCVILFSLISLQSNAQILTVRQQQDDIDSLYSKIETVMPYPFRYIKRGQFVHMVDSLKKSITSSNATSKFYLNIAQLFAMLKNGHLYIEIPINERLKYTNEGGKIMPVRLYLDHGNLIVNFPYRDCGIARGDTITSINDVCSNEIVKKLYSLQGSEINNDLKDKGMEQYITPLLWYIYGWGDEYKFRIKNHGYIKTIYASGVPNQEAIKMINTHKATNRDFRVDYLDKDSAIMTIPNFYQTKELSVFCDSVFKQLRDKKIKLLYINVRDNLGGKSSNVELLLSYLRHPAYDSFRKVIIRVSKETIIYYKRMDQDIYNEIKDLPNGKFFELKSDKTKSNKHNSNIFKGKVIVLANYRTYSAASYFVHMIAKHHIGNVIGTTGCPSVCSGNPIQYSLPNSHLNCYIPTGLFCE